MIPKVGVPDPHLILSSFGVVYDLSSKKSYVRLLGKDGVGGFAIALNYLEDSEKQLNGGRFSFFDPTIGPEFSVSWALGYTNKDEFLGMLHEFGRPWNVTGYQWSMPDMDDFLVAIHFKNAGDAVEFKLTMC